MLFVHKCPKPLSLGHSFINFIDMSKKIGLFLVLLTTVVLFSCNDKPTGPTPVVLSGKVVGAENQDFYIRKEAMNLLDVDTIKTGLAGEFTYDFMLEEPTYFTLMIGRNQVSLYMRPGDSLKLDADIQMFDQLKFSGASALYNEYLMKFALVQMDFARAMPMSFRAQEDAAVYTIDSLRTEQMNTLHELEKNYSKLDARFLENEKNRIQYFWGLNRVMYPLYYSYYNRIRDFSPSPNYDTYLAELNSNDSNLMALPEYRQFVYNRLSSLVSDAYKAVNSEDMSYTVLQLQEIKKQFVDPYIQSYLAYKVMNDHLSYEGIKDFDQIQPLYEELCTVTSFKAAIDKELAKWEQIKKGMPAHDFSGTTLSGDTVRLSDFKGKYVYVDVWATWCKPCLGEIPYMLDLEEKMQGKNIVFMGVSVDRDYQAWIKFMGKQNLAGVQIYAGFSEDLSGYYKINSIPRFMLFDPNGNIVEAKANRPSGGVYEELMQLEGI